MQQNTLKEHSAGFILYDALKANDEAALKDFYTNNYYKAEQYILKNNGTIEYAKDIYQEAFIAVWRNIQSEKFHPENENSPAAYLHRIVKNKWLDHLRSQHHKKTIPLAGDTDSVEEVWPEEDLLYLTEVKNKFKYLGENCKQVLIRFYYKKESMRAIAEKFEWTEATAKNNKYRCLQRLRDLLKK
jgi:RNA polymerase sigma factor (sigma-70 family)